MGEIQPTEVSIELARLHRDASFIQADLKDVETNDRLIDTEQTYLGANTEYTPDALEQQEIDEALKQIPIDPNEEYEQVMKIAQSTDKKMSIDEAMGLPVIADDTVLEELMNCCNE